MRGIKSIVVSAPNLIASVPYTDNGHDFTKVTISNMQAQRLDKRVITSIRREILKPSPSQLILIATKLDESIRWTKASMPPAMSSLFKQVPSVRLSYASQRLNRAKWHAKLIYTLLESLSTQDMPIAA